MKSEERGLEVKCDLPLGATLVFNPLQPARPKSLPGVPGGSGATSESRRVLRGALRGPFGTILDPKIQIWGPHGIPKSDIGSSQTHFMGF